MGLFSTPKTWTQLAAEVPPERKTWIVAVGGSRQVNQVKAAEDIDAAVAEVEACGWRLVALVPMTAGVTQSSAGGSVSTSMLGHFRRP